MKHVWLFVMLALSTVQYARCASLHDAVVDDNDFAEFEEFDDEGCDVFEWSDWSDCSQTCGGGLRFRNKLFGDSATADDCQLLQTTQKEACGTCDCMDSVVDQWTQWTTCSAVDSAEECGWGQRTRTRNVSDGTDNCMSGVQDSQIEDCFLGPCDCDLGFEYSNHSKCHPTCQQPSPDPLCSLNLEPSCVCAEDMYMDLTTQECVPVEQCGYCVHENVTYKPGDRWECGECDYCTCRGGTIVPEHKQCPDIHGCNLTTHRLEPSKDDCCPVDCVEKRCELKTHPPQYIYSLNGECVSSETYDVQYCEGDCPSSVLTVDYTSGNLGEKECQCCTASIKELLTIKFNCGNGTTMDHLVPILGQCYCNYKCVPEEGQQSSSHT